LIPLSAREQKARAHQGLNGALLSYEVEYQHKAVNMCLGGRISGRCCEGSAKGSKVVVPLIGASSSVKILDFTAQVELKQRYENQNDFPLEAVYEFPLPESAAVTAFTIEIDGKTIHSKILEKEQAREKYDNAIARGHGGYLLEENKSGAFTTSIGNLPPGKEVLITIVYVQELQFKDSLLQFTLPTTDFAPNGQGETAKFTRSKSNEYEKAVPYGVRINAEVQTGSRLVSVTSPSHNTTLVQSGFQGHYKALVSIEQTDGSPLTEDWVLQVGLAQRHAPVARIQKYNDSYVAMVALHPEMDEENVHSEIIFVVDRSGSMQGSKMKSVQQTLEFFLRSLPEGTMFNIVSFGSSYSKLFPSSVEYNQKNFTKALSHVQSMDADMGGTEIDKPMLAIFKESTIEGVPRQVFLLTDGEVDNTQTCINICKQHAMKTRVFTFGIGSGADKVLVKGMAEAANGNYEFISDTNNMDEKVLRQLGRALKPAFTDLSLDWGKDLSPVITQTPYHCPPLFNGGTIVFYGFLPKGSLGTHNVTLHAKTSTGPFSTTVALNFDQAMEGDSVVKLAARSLIRDLQDARSYMHDDKCHLLPKYTASSVTDAIVKTSLEHQVMSKHTSFLAIEKRTEATQGTMQTFSNTRSRSRGSVSSSDDDYESEDECDDMDESEEEAGNMPAVDADMLYGDDDMEEEKYSAPISKKKTAAPVMQEKKKEKKSKQMVAPSSSSARDSSAISVNANNNSNDINVVREVMKQQDFSGSFSLNTLQSVASNVTSSVIAKFVKDHSLKSEAAVITLFVALVFELKFAAQKSVWDLVMKKAKTWVKKQLGVTDLTGIENDAKTLLQPLL
jgi:hypothetical protein